jgi:hypothetical protein
MEENKKNKAYVAKLDVSDGGSILFFEVEGWVKGEK